jgi:bis(5'-nucleosyl)-tetraphosphatase (symmetrical)
MAHYVIGDVQGCYSELQALVKKIKFNPNKDKIIFAGRPC